LWPYYGQIWPNIGLITIFGEDNFTKQFYVEKDGDSRKSSLVDPIQHNGHFWPYYGQIRPNIGLITILCEDNFTKTILCKKGGDSRKSSLVDRIQDTMAIFGHIMAKFGQI